MFEKVEEATLRSGDAGLVPDGDGWFIVNIADAQSAHSESFGHVSRFESSDANFPELAFNVRVIQPGQPNGLYHRESNAEAFLVLSGECLALVEEQERPMRRGDFLYVPPGTAHIFVGAGDGPCAIVMVSNRNPEEELLYPVSEVGARHGASAEEETDDPRVAYASSSPRRPASIGDVPW
jgi:uncharacterized cupin superfamily protein